MSEQQKEEDPSKDKITFTYPLSIVVPTGTTPSNSFFGVDLIFVTRYMHYSAKWKLKFKRDRFRLSNLHFVIHINDDGTKELISTRVWNGSCFISYNLFSESDILLYSSPRIKMVGTRGMDSFRTPSEFMDELEDELNERNVAKFVILLEIHLPTKYFFRPFDMPSCELSKLLYEYPKDIENDFRFDYLKECDYVIKCSDGTVPASRLLLNIKSEFFEKRFQKSGDEHEFVVEHLSDVVKPIITYLQTYCFQMPKSFDLEYAKRLLKAIEFFVPAVYGGKDFKMKSLLESCVHKELCKKFVEEKHSFTSILQWLSIALFRFQDLQNMIITVIVDKFYFEWHQTFPENARNNQNPIYRDVFGEFGDDDENPEICLLFFYEIGNCMVSSRLTNVIL